jgi:mono/diheme cytochrome c family protein
MTVPVTLKVAALAVVATGFYTWVGQLVPQKEVHPPEVVEIAADLTAQELVPIGQKIFAGKGLCTTCHTLGKSGALRFPDLDGVAVRAATRVPGLSQIQYLAQSLYEPDVFVVPGFNPGMPAMDRPPIGLTSDEIKAVVAYLQTLGGEATVTLAMDLKGGGDGETGGEAGAVASIAEPAADGAAALLVRYGCADCHHTDQPGRLTAASLFDVGARLPAAEIERRLIAHDPPLPAAYAARVTLAEVRAMAEYLVSLRGTGSGGPG